MFFFRSGLCALLLGYGALHTLFYGVLYAPMFADLDFSVVGIGRYTYQ